MPSKRKSPPSGNSDDVDEPASVKRSKVESASQSPTSSSADEAGADAYASEPLSVEALVNLLQQSERRRIRDRQRRIDAEKALKDHEVVIQQAALGAADRGELFTCNTHSIKVMCCCFLTDHRRLALTRSYLAVCPALYQRGSPLQCSFHPPVPSSTNPKLTQCGRRMCATCAAMPCFWKQLSHSTRSNRSMQMLCRPPWNSIAYYNASVRMARVFSNSDSCTGTYTK